MTSLKERILGQVLRVWGQQLDLTLHVCHHLIKISTTYVGDLVVGETHPSERVLGRLAAALLVLAFSLLGESLAFAKTLNFKLVDLSTPYTDPIKGGWHADYYDFAQAAVQYQADAVASFYHAAGGIHIYGFNESAPRKAWPLYVQNECISTGQNYPAYHWTAKGLPYGCVASLNGGGFWWMTKALEHEMAEVVGDPSGRRYEIVDPVINYSGMIVNGVFTFNYIYPYSFNYPFVDFVLPKRVWRKVGFKDYLHKVPRN